jgi:RNA polymerase sigma-70 factor (ECF subfamily)
MRDDAEIVDAVRRGDVEAFRFLVERHQDRVHGVLRQLTNDPDRVEELAQEAFVRAFRGIGSFRGESQFGTWLIQIAVYAARDLNKRERRACLVPLHEIEEGSGAVAALTETRSAYDPLESLNERELTERLEWALENLPPAYREVFVLRVIEDMSYDEIAEITGDSVGSLKVRLHRARSLLKDAMEDIPRGNRSARVRQSSNS